MGRVFVRLLKVQQNNIFMIENVFLVVDRPCLGYSTGKDTNVLSGWFAAFDNSKILEIECAQVGIKCKVSPSIGRDDVVNHFAKRGANDINKYCGFKFEISGEAVVSFYIDGSLFSEVLFSYETHDQPPDIETWRKMHVAGSDHTEIQARRIAENIVAYSDPWNMLVTSVSEISQGLKTHSIDSGKIKDFVVTANSKEFLSDMVAMAVEDGKLKVRSIYSDAYAFCNESYFEAPFNYLKFEDESTGEFFYIAQHFSFFDALYAPKYNFTYAKPTTTPAVHHKDIVKACGSFSSKKSAGGFNGLACMHSRPYHFLYDISYGLWALHEAKLLNEVPKIFLSENQAFYSVAKLFDLNVDELVLSTAGLKEQLNAPGFIFFPGLTDFNFKNDEVFRRYANLDAVLLSNCAGSSNRADSLVKYIDKSSHVFWFGITSQKRKLINQVEEIAEVISTLSRMYVGAIFIIDGWTSPLKAGVVDAKEIISDESVFSEIKNLLLDCKNVHSVIGFTSQEKINIGKYVDFFVVNNGTGSMHVDRICGRRGLTHISNAWTAEQDFSIHRNSTRISNLCIQDIPSEISRIDFTSYKIERGVLLPQILRALNDSPLSSFHSYSGEGDIYES